MKKTLFYVCMVAVLGCFAVMTTSCSEKMRALNRLEDLADEVEENGDNYGIGEWQDVFKQYQAISTVIDEHYADYTQKQHARINRAKSTIKTKAWASMKQKFNLLPETIKAPIVEWLQSLFPSSSDDATEEMKE